jgi:uncharacterized protein YqgQ
VKKLKSKLFKKSDESDELSELEEMYNQGLISKDAYEKSKKALKD